MTVDEISRVIAGWGPSEPLIRRLYLFGSRAKGTARPDGDADLAILHNIGPEMAASCDPEVAHWITWDEFQEEWTRSISRLLSVREHVHQVDRDSRRYIVPGLKACRVCLYRRGIGQ